MNTNTNRFVALALSAAMALGIVAAVNGLANAQYAAADSQEMARYGQAHVAVQHVTIVGRHAA